ncbi:MAG: hypothetical protein WCS31_02685 [Verrucomicrobiae bacterium]
MAVPDVNGVCRAAHRDDSYQSPLLHTIMHNLLSGIKDRSATEGSESEGVRYILKIKLQIDQIIVGFHHRFSGVGMRKTLDSFASLRKAGYRLFHISPWCEEYAFIRR